MSARLQLNGAQPHVQSSIRRGAHCPRRPVPTTAPVGRTLLSLVALCGAAAAQTQVAADFGRMMSPTAAAHDQLGLAVAVDGVWGVGGAPLDDNAGVTDAGTAHVYRRTAGGWFHAQELLPGPGSMNRERGSAVAIHGDTIAVGSYLDSSVAVYAGAVSVYVRDDSVSPPVWVEVQQLLDPQGAGGDRFGAAVSIDGDKIAVGCPYDDGAGGNTGSVLVFQRSDGGTPNQPLDDSWSFSQRLTANPEQGHARFGSSVDLSGSRLVAGAPHEAAPQGESGAAYLFSEAGGVWTQQARLLHPASAAVDLFGQSVAVDDMTVLVGAPGVNLTGNNSNEGAAYFFEPVSGFWTLTAMLLAPNAQVGDQFGGALDLEGDVAAVGAALEDTPQQTAGAVYLFRRGGAGWDHGQTLSSHDAEFDDRFGTAVALDADDLFVGSPRTDAGAANAGAVYAFRLAFGHFETFVVGDGSAVPCPCTNESVAGMRQGCVNSTGLGARLSVFGTDSAQSDNVQFSAVGLPALQPALLFSGLNDNGGVSFGDGIKAVAGSLVRRGTLTATPEGLGVWGPDLGDDHPWSVGQTVYFQCWYRDPIGGPCGSGFNLTSGVGVAFQ